MTANQSGESVVVPRLPMKVAIANAIWMLDRGEGTNARVEMVKAQSILSAAPSPAAGSGEADTETERRRKMAVMKTLMHPPASPADGRDAGVVGELVEASLFVIDRCGGKTAEQEYAVEKLRAALAKYATQQALTELSGNPGELKAPVSTETKGEGE